ncbi:phage baseplate assembly protein V [Aureimonas phyllosphaerae]|uniref:Phage baseplate assembly protein gpV n=1 Tax=Aureimonas phyllosphaerae TaxID=1166078 RepID=A0A7W6C3T2_9HYPH|nr:phage baseplate assembly protein V [Aureimonas phyllosphaerae]MBB3937932.1 phage baseplate assembly protein gpV [Aureimonas phyllosphaerae]MBB3961895.1 phage baseplate assembly protein gpV [Aureimonas phyllosphaerae]SFF54510.1 Type VI secretion system, phage-baseplate injector [Aureimonas phyllosphaerae]
MSVALKTELERMRSAMANMVRVGPVHAVDAKRGYRLKLGQDAEGQPFLSPWLPHPETGKTSVPLKVGQIVGVVSANGDLRQGAMFRGGYSEANASPNDDMAANVFEDAGVRVEIGGGELRLIIGGVTWTFSGAGEAQAGGQKTHDDLNVGSTHRHTGVVVGGALTEGPV